MKKWLVCICISLTSFRIDVDNIHTLSSDPEPLSLGSPVRHALSLSGCFGEIRHNHFHAGVDIRSSHSGVPDEIVSASNGFVSRIEIHSDSYGKILYVQHPGGFTTVYAHILSFRPDIEAKVREFQYQTQEYEVTLDFNPREFPVQKGDHIAYMGNTGASRGVHLHFELRKTLTNEVLDPLEFGLALKDNIAPQLKKVKLYGFAQEGGLVFEKILPKKLLGPVQAVTGDYFGIGIEGQDRNNQSWTTTGLKNITLFIDGKQVYHYHQKGWSIEDSRYMNAHIDYKNKLQALGQIHRCYKLPGNCLPLYHTDEGNGLFQLEDTAAHEVVVKLSDAAGNTSADTFQIRKKNGEKVLAPFCPGQMVFYDQDFKWNCPVGFMYFENGTLYESTPLVFDTLSQRVPRMITPWMGVSGNGIPLHKKIKVGLIAYGAVKENLREKYFVAFKSGNVSMSTLDSKWQGDTLISSHNQLGYFSMQLDTLAPSISAVNFRYDMSKQRYMKFRISDNIPCVKVSKELKYHAYIDGNWVLMEHDAKSRTIRHEFSPELEKGKHELRIILTDGRNNQKEYNASFVR